ncbi:MAG: hypothetical protein EA369_07140 [Bradymonadales bacterium]|nr:MAG: hypothetical protein EA369_07140 [Bradymonadales bacterium]
MKKLIVSLKSSTEVLQDFESALKAGKSRKRKTPHYEVSFDNKKDFDRFARNIFILSSIAHFKPNSIYELGKLIEMDVSNLNKIILFFEEIGVLHIQRKKLKGREIKKPIVDYDQIEFDLKAA